ncbi:hypothetical protein SAMN05216456_3199 [Devosia crocina]|uniref:TonB C-terminal domain-containing protein n=1 Tax=Devosia crocina TaxID=429728 RepID=A0A1I7NTQ9_9HYPH|nr:hypothetical protein [Devosia crocina]SFV37978.1 hypothetical protein SAMN05216456_3199 [Devosia crocina]
MIRASTLLLTLFLSAPVLAQPVTQDEYVKQTQAIAIRVQQQLMACWMVPQGEEGFRLGLDIVFFGNGEIDGEAVLSAETTKIASKRASLRESVLAALERCVPFTGLEELGAAPDERFSVTIFFQS